MRWFQLAVPRPGRYAIRIGPWLFGVERSTIEIYGQRYMTRWIAYLGPIGFRLHKFYRGDDDRAPHDHPFWFVTIPLGTGYAEWVYGDNDISYSREGRTWLPRMGLVRPWVPKFRSSKHRHVVIGPTKREPGRIRKQKWQLNRQHDPFWTFCIFGFTQPDWYFWPTPDTKIHWTKWEN